MNYPVGLLCALFFYLGGMDCALTLTSRVKMGGWRRLLYVLLWPIVRVNP